MFALLVSPKPLYTGRIGEGLPCKQAFSLRPPCKPNDSSELHLIVPVHWYFGTIGLYFPWRDTSFRGRGMFSAMLLAISIVALSQFALYYWRAVLAGGAPPAGSKPGPGASPTTDGRRGGQAFPNHSRHDRLDPRPPP